MERISAFRPIASVMETRFHRGFFRRMLPNRDHLRHSISELSLLKYQGHMEKQISEYPSRKRNLITGQGLRADAPQGLRCLPQSVFKLPRAAENYRRVRNGPGRFHVEGSPLVAPSVECESVLIGFAGRRKRHRVHSLGIFDNFSHTQDCLSKPFSAPERRNRSQISFG